jgi:hypothetical protein
MSLPIPVDVQDQSEDAINDTKQALEADELVSLILAECKLLEAFALSLQGLDSELLIRSLQAAFRIQPECRQSLENACTVLLDLEERVRGES